MRIPLHLTLVTVTVWSCALLGGSAWAGPDAVVDAVTDLDWDGVAADDDADDEDPCVPSRDSSRCDKDGDGVDNGLERGRGTDEDDVDSDHDGVNDFDEADDDRNGNGVLDALDVCVPVGCSDDDAVVDLNIPVVDGGCAQTASPAAALVLLLLVLTNNRTQRAARSTVRLVRWTSRQAAAAARSSSSAASPSAAPAPASC